MRFARAAVLLGVLLAVAVPGEARADGSSKDLVVGAQLVAVDNVTLHRAEIAKGSKVSIAQVMVREGRVDGAAVELADGHIVKVALATIRNFFRVAEPSE
jgi:hypothetical protein